MAKRREKRERRSMVLEPDAAGIDIGAEEIFVAVPPDRDEESTRRFSSFTCDLHALADWLGRCRIQTVASCCLSLAFCSRIRRHSCSIGIV